jgi:DNA-binding response OmpR family regulator
MEASDRPVRVLVVEDDEEIAQVLQRALRLEGYEVRLAGDGVAALDEVHAFLPDILVLDLGLPRLDGIDVTRSTRASRGSTSAPTTTLSSRSSARSCSRACARCCAGARRAAWPRCASVT